MAYDTLADHSEGCQRVAALAHLAALDQTRMSRTTLPVHVGQAEVAALVAVGQPLVIEAEQVQDRRLQVVDVDRVLDDVEAEVVGRAVRSCPA